MRLVPADSAMVQAVLEAAPGYWTLSCGAPPQPGDGERVMTSLPPGSTPAAKAVLGLEVNGEIVGCLDVIRGWPDEHTAMLGLLILTEAAQGRGHGRAAFEALQPWLWPEIERIRIGVLLANASALAFWRHLGFVETGARKPWSEGSVRTEVLVLERDR